jgi:hypothetical protein
VESEDLFVADRERVVWTGRPDGLRVAKAIQIPKTSKAVVLLMPPSDPSRPVPSYYPSDLVCVNAEGIVVWRAAALGLSDGWVEVSWNNGVLVANTWSCYCVRLDPADGSELSRIFTK